MQNKSIVLLGIIGILIIGGVIFEAPKLFKALDVIGKGAITSFKVVTKKMEDKIESNNVNNGWSLLAPDNAVKFIWSKNFSKSSFYDVMLEFPSKPFVAAGLDVDKLSDGIVFDDVIMVGTKLSNKKIIDNSEISPFTSFKKIIELKRERIKYHTALDHYGIDLENGNMFEWAKDMATNDKDIVFVLNPEPFIEAGVNPKQVDGWLYAKVPTMKDGKKVEVYKFLKPFNIK